MERIYLRTSNGYRPFVYRNIVHFYWNRNVFTWTNILEHAESKSENFPHFDWITNIIELWSYTCIELPSMRSVLLYCTVTNVRAGFIP